MIRTIAAIIAMAVVGIAGPAVAAPAGMAGSPAPAYAACAEEDGSTPGQVFPCHWDAQAQGNGAGESYILLGPVCTAYEVAAADAAHTQGFTLRLACDDQESLGVEL